MKIGVLGSGPVGKAISERLSELGNSVMIGTRDTQKLDNWRSANQEVQVGSFAETAIHGEMILNATSGSGSLAALEMAGEPNLNGKILVDISNPLDFSKGFPPSLLISNTDSLGEKIQRTFPAVKVVKTLNTVTAEIMIHPRKLADGDHLIFVSGNDALAKAKVSELLRGFGWSQILDLGDITTARGTEMYLVLWVSMFQTLGTGMFNFKVIK
jgi:8-hydroxy-5-deazaflavin:NADPH oxidoreductase